MVKHTTSHTKVGIGSQVVIYRKGQKNKTKHLHVVGEFEADPSEGKISSASPLGQAMLNKKKGDLVVVQAPSKQIEWIIQQIK